MRKLGFREKTEVSDMTQHPDHSRFLKDHKCCLMVNYFQIRNKLRRRNTRLWESKSSPCGADLTDFPVSLLLSRSSLRVETLVQEEILLFLLTPPLKWQWDVASCRALGNATE